MTEIKTEINPLTNPLCPTEQSLLKPISSLAEAYHRCQTLGMRLSRQRKYILELLWTIEDHLAAREIYDRLNQQGKEIGYTSVYQNLEALSSQGIIECVERCDGRLYGNKNEIHSHVNCLDTRQIIDVQVQLPPEIIKQIEAQTGVQISEYRVDFYGYRGDRQEQDK